MAVIIIYYLRLSATSRVRGAVWVNRDTLLDVETDVAPEYNIMNVFLNVEFSFHEDVASVPSVHTVSLEKTTVHYGTGGHVNVLSDYKKSGSSKVLKTIHCHRHRVTGILIKCCQTYIPPALLIISQTSLPSKCVVFAKY